MNYDMRLCEPTLDETLAMWEKLQGTITDEQPSFGLPQAVLYFTYQMQTAYLTARLLRQAGIDPAGL